MENRKRINNNQKRKYRNKKIKNYKKLLIKVALGLLVFMILVMSHDYYIMNMHNTIRKTVENNSTTIYAEVMHRATGKIGVNFATYKFIVNDRIYNGRTYKSYDGDIGDKILVKYSNSNPEINIYTNDITPETFVNDVLRNTLILMIGILCFPAAFVLIVVIYAWIELRKKDKRQKTPAHNTR